MPFKIFDASDRLGLAPLFAHGWSAGDEVSSGVASILENVRVAGDAALLEYTQQFDSAHFTLEMLSVPVPALEARPDLVTPEIASALAVAKTRVEDFHRRQLPSPIDYVQTDGTAYGFHYVPLRAVGAYVPAGTAPLASSVIMNAVPAKVAGVERLAVFCPPQPDGTVHPAVLYACSLCGVDELYAVGGAQAIAAAAFGTQTIAAVDKIVGPGNRWVTEAKRQVFGTCAIDGLAGPSEVLVVADEDAGMEQVVWELLAQAEHDPHARVAVVSESMSMLERCTTYLDHVRGQLPSRSGVIAAVLERGLYFVHASDRAELFDVIDSFAPEHLSLQVRDPEEYLTLIRNAGAIFVGPYTPVACGDYIAGTNHVLPTSGSARFSSGLRTLDFMRSFSVLRNSARRMAGDAAAIEALARFEGLDAHARTARMRAS
ncbi:MAG: histidinol dehydrogenase [Candidatus Eremiobacteraeota bacterium]|nr:histidinol dehydrogenase [Candidatus Eremiobacteraeota bacterium]